MQEFEPIRSIIETLKNIVRVMKKELLAEEEILDVQSLAEQINLSLYRVKRLKFQRKYDMESTESYFGYVEELETLIALWEQSISGRKGSWLDIEFWNTYEYFKYAAPEAIYENTVGKFLELPESRRQEFLTLPQKVTFLGDKIDDSKQDFTLIKRYVDMLVAQAEKYKWLYGRLADHKSRIILNGIIQYWLEFNAYRLVPLRETMYQTYHDLDIVSGSDMDVLVDVGAGKGQYILDYINNYGVCQKIYAYESNPYTHRMLMLDMFAYPNVVTAAKEFGSYTLDDEIKERVTVLKIDAQGREKEALMGAERHIREDKPKLIIPAYYQPEEIFELPCLIHNMHEDYKFYIRYYGQDTIWPNGYALFAV